jgi:hypothetical protein
MVQKYFPEFFDLPFLKRIIFFSRNFFVQVFIHVSPRSGKRHGGRGGIHRGGHGGMPLFMDITRKLIIIL